MRINVDRESSGVIVAMKSNDGDAVTVALDPSAAATLRAMIQAAEQDELYSGECAVRADLTVSSATQKRIQ